MSGEHECEFQRIIDIIPFCCKGESMSGEHECEFEGGNHYGEVLVLKPDGLFTRKRHICQGHLYYVCWNYTILIHVVGTKRDHTGVLKQILKPFDELYKELLKEVKP